MTSNPNAKMSHVDENGKANMVDVSNKQDSQREARAEGFISLNESALQQVSNNSLSKGDVFSVARIAGIQGAKNCPNLIPLCHPLMLSKIDIDFEVIYPKKQIRVICLCKVKGNTGVEMEALTGVSVACLTLFDMCKAVDPDMRIHGIRVLEKIGGKSGLWRAKTEEKT